MTSTEKRLITAEDLYRLKLISGVRIAPDGRNVVYTLHRVDEKTEKKYANLWVADTSGQAPASQFTYGDQADTQACWSPDGRTIAFLSNRGDKEKPPQLHLIPFHGGEARQLVKIEGTVTAFSWSPDGARLLCEVRKTDAEVLEREKDEQKKKLGTVSRQYDRLFYKLDGYGYLPHERKHLWIVDAASGEALQITDHHMYDETGASWSPDGNQIVFVSNRSAEPDANPDLQDLYIIPAEDGPVDNSTMRKLETPTGSKSYPTFSPDGRWIAYYAQEGVGISFRNQNLWVVPADGSGPAVNLTSAYDLHVSAWTLNDLMEPETMAPTWTPDSQRLYFPVVYHGSSVLHSIACDGSDLRTVIGEGGVVGAFNFDRLHKTMAYYYGRMDDPGQIYAWEMDTDEPRQLTRHNRDLLDSVNLGTMEEAWCTGPDGNDLQGWILKPPGFDPALKYPSILEIHGGPLTQYGNYFMHEFYYFASKGFVVYFSNPRGGRGYGEGHAGAIHGDWGNRDYADLMALTDYMAKQPYIDTERMGVTGGSYGGYMTVWIIGHSDRFRAAVSQRCVSNFVSMWGSSDMNWTFQHLVGDKPPFEDLQSHWDHSPIKYIGNAKTPTLVIHNENDHRCPIEQSEQVFVALKRLGVETGFVRFPEEFHGLSRNGRTDRRIARLNHIISWFERYCK